MNKKDIKKYILLFAVLLLGTSFFMLKGNGLMSFINSVKSLDIRYILIGILCGVMFIVCESINLRTLLREFGYKVNIKNTLKYAFIGFFFSSVTPSASGGQPMQVYYMKRDNINISHSTLSLMVELAIFQVVTLFIGMTGLIYNRAMFVGKMGGMKLLIIFGVSMNLLLIGIIMLAMFKPQLLLRLADSLIDLLNRVGILKEKAKYINSIEKYVREFGECALLIKERPSIILKVGVTTIIQLVLKYSIPFWVYKGFGFTGISIINMILIQAILSIAVSSLPLPGAVGASERSFLILYKTVFPQTIINSAALISRGVGFYAIVMLSGVVAIIGSMTVNKIKRVKVRKLAY